MFAEDGETSTVRRPERHLTRLQIKAMDTMQLAHNATLIEIKARYKEPCEAFSSRREWRRPGRGRRTAETGHQSLWRVARLRASHLNRASPRPR